MLMAVWERLSTQDMDGLAMERDAVGNDSMRSLDIQIPAAGTVKRFFAIRPHVVPALLAPVLLLAALGRWPHDYYRRLRWVTCAAAIFVAWSGYAYGRLWAICLFGSETGDPSARASAI